MPDYVDNVLLVLREIVKTEPNPEFRVVAKQAADQLHLAIGKFYSDPTRENLQAIIGLWALGQRIVDVWTAPQPTPPRASAGACEEWGGCGYREAA